MTGHVTADTPDALLKRIISEKRQRLRKNVHILFLGLSAEEADPIIALLRGARLAPRGRQVQSSHEFTAALTERAWDLILSPQTEHAFTANDAIQILHRLNKDIPVIQLVAESTCQTVLQGLKARMAAVVALEEPELLLMQIRRQLEHLEQRRQLKKIEALLAKTEQQCQQLASIAELPVAYVNDAYQPSYINPAFIDLFGLDADNNSCPQELEKFIALPDRERLNRALATALHSHEEAALELTGRRVDGSNFLAHFTLQHTRHQNQDCLQVIIQPDIVTRSDAFADRDPVTRLHDKQYLLRKLEKAVQKALPGGADCSLLYIQFDNYTALLDALGTTGGDLILADLAELLRTKINKAHICARLESGVFGVLFHDPCPDKALKLAELLRRAIARLSFSVAGKSAQTTCSIGICAINDNAPHYLELVERARSAAEDVAASNGNGIKLYERQTPVDSLTEEAAAIELIEFALTEERFTLLYQPIVGLAAHNTSRGYEVLLRLQDKDSGAAISPNTFLTTLEHAQTCVKLDQWVIAETFKRYASSLAEQRHNQVYINLTASTFQTPDMLVWIQDQLKQQRIPAGLITFQISESDMTTSIQQAQSFCSGLKKLGCKVCIKHFGISANAEILRKQIKPELIKLDGSFVQDLNSSAETDKAFTAFVHTLNEAGVQTIAPLVEDARVMGKLWKSGVDYIQGYYLQQPSATMDYDFFE